ncbi:MAG: aryl-sulfate sulfotransferase [Halobacteriota archaeon]
MSNRLSLLVAGLGVLLIVGTVATAAVTAPPATVDGTDRDLLVGIQGPGPQGKLVAQASDEERWHLADAGSYHGVERLDNGSVLAAYAVGGSRDCGGFEPPCARTGVRIVESDPEPTVVWEWSYPVRSFSNSEVHDVEMLPSGDLLVADMEYESIFVLDMETRERVWTWNASSHYEPPADPTTEDWLHINDVDRIGDGRYLVSVRNANQLVVVERGEGVVEVINEDHDPDDEKQQGDPSLFRGQHNPQWLGEDAVLVADSSNDRIVELHRVDGEWEIAWSKSRALGLPFAWPRDADRLPNGNTLITDSRNHRVVEVSEDGEVVGAWKTPKLPYEADVDGVGESVATGTYGYDGAVNAAAAGEGHYPIIGSVYVGLVHAVGLPYWLSEIHLGLLVVGVTCLLFGLVRHTGVPVSTRR